MTTFSEDELKKLRKIVSDLESSPDLTEDEIKHLRAIINKIPLEALAELVLMIEDRRHRVWLRKVIKNSLSFIGLVITTLWLAWDKLTGLFS